MHTYIHTYVVTLFALAGMAECFLIKEMILKS